MRLWKRLLGLALCLCTAVCVMSVSASAAAEHSHPICGAAHIDIGDHTGTCNNVIWTEVTQDNVSDGRLTLAGGGSYYLGTNIAISNGITINGTVNLCLNGHSITKTSESDTFAGVIKVESGSSFTLCDCNGSGMGNGKITHADGVTGRGVLVGSSSVKTTFFLMYGGTISGNRINGQDGAGVRVHNASFKMYGGTISENHVEGTPSDGGGGVNARGKFIMYGGEISRNTSNGDCGGVAVVGDSFEMHGGIISGNTATGDGGGVGLWNDSFRLSGGTISGNTATRNGGGVYFSGNDSNTLTISDAVEIRGNSAANGGGVYLNSRNLTVTGGSIINNNAADGGGGVYFAGSSFNVSSNVSITGNKSGCTADANGDLTGGTDNNVYLPADKIITITGALTGDPIGVTTENTPDNSNYVRIASGNKDYATPEKFRYENDGTIAVSAVVSGNTASLVVCRHNWSDAWATDTFQHWKECSICKGKKDPAAHTYDQEIVNDIYKASEATCTSPAVYYKSCVCGKKGTETDTFTSGAKDPTNHTGSPSGWQTDFSSTYDPTEYHVRKYLCCGAIAETEKHDWGTGTVETQPTCTTKGVRSYDCSKCTAGKKEDIPANGHDYTAAAIKPEALKTRGTCISKAVYYYSCSVCGDIEKGNGHTFNGDLDPSNHTESLSGWHSDGSKHWKEYPCCKVKTDEGTCSGGTATCTEKAVCTTCKAEYGEKNPDNHDWSIGWTSDENQHWHTCTRKGCSATSGEAEHTWDNGKITKQPTCTEAGERLYTCTKCSRVKTERIDATGHTYGQDWKHDATHHWHECTDCDATDRYAEHSGGTATCTAEAICEFCRQPYGEKNPSNHSGTLGDWQSDDTRHWKLWSCCSTEAEGGDHNWDGGAVSTEPTCTASGEKTYTCTDCGRTKTESVSALGHDWGEWTVTTPATADAEGVETRICGNNGAHRQTRAIPKITSATCPRDAACPLAGFSDLVPAAWYHDGVHYCLENGLMQGFAGGLFLPEGSTTRGQLAAVLWRLEGSPAADGGTDFTDVGPDSWCAAAVRWASSVDVVLGFGDGRFAPDEAVTREQTAAILQRYAAYKGWDLSAGEGMDLSSFADAADVSRYAVPAMQWACGSGLLLGDGTALLPQGTALRVQTAAMIQRFCTAFSAPRALS